jgi:hypothetical protein
MGVTAHRVMEPFDVPARAIEIIPPAPADMAPGAGGAWMAPRTLNASIRAFNRLLAAGARVTFTTAARDIGDGTWPAGSIVIEGVARDRLVAAGDGLGVPFRTLDAADLPPRTSVRAPRIGLYRSHLANIDEGWVRWLLEQYEFPYRSLGDADIRRGALDGLDVLVFSDEEGQEILNGHLAGTMPPEYAGGIGVEGALHVKRFVEHGGWLLAIDHAVDFAIEQLGLPVRNIAKDLRPQEFFVPGSLVRLQFDRTSPLTAGLAPDGIAMFARSQSLSVVPAAVEGDRRMTRDVEVFATFAQKDLLASGWELGGRRYLAGRDAGVRVPVGRGQVVLLAVRPHFRGQPHNLFKLLFNPLFQSTVARRNGA